MTRPSASGTLLDVNCQTPRSPRLARYALLALALVSGCDGGSDRSAAPGAGSFGTGGTGIAGTGSGGTAVAGSGTGGRVAAGAGGVGAGMHGMDAGHAPGSETDRDAAASTDAGLTSDAAKDATAPSTPSFLIGADITWVQADEAHGVTFSDGTTKDILALLRDHGFNAIRLRTFVDPRDADGYDPQQGFGDLAHTIAFAKRIKAAGMTFLLDFHYSDNWADPGKQCVPVAWQGMSLGDMAGALADYTKDAIAQLVAAGARPDLVQIGNEITPGMLLHLCDASGHPTGPSPVSGSTANWSNLATLLNAGIGAVHAVDPSIAIMLHIDRGGDKPSEPAGSALQISSDWIDQALAHGVQFDVFGESCYQRYQGDPNDPAKTATGWKATFNALQTRFPQLEFVAAEYGPMQREINDVLYGMSDQRGLGTFNWEPTHQTDGNTGHTLFSLTGDPRTATADLAIYDELAQRYADRL